MQSAQKSDKPAAERRLLTTVFTDICGYTALSEAIDPEEVEELLEVFRGLVTSVVTEHGGITNQFMGDAVLALFGVPAAHDDDAQRAVGAALAMHADFARELRPYEERWVRQLALHTGIETGLVVAKRGDSRSGAVYNVNGDAVNVAARLLAMAGPGELLVGPRTKSLVTPFFVLDEPRMLSLKGKSEAVPAYPVLSVSTARTRFDAERMRGLTHFVGREAELSALAGAWQRLEQGRGATVLVCGQAGVGKTRLLHRFVEDVESRARMLYGRADPYGQVGPYEPFLRALRAELRISDTGSDESRRKRAREGLGSHLQGQEEGLNALLQMLSLEPDSKRAAAGADASDESLRLAIEAAFVQWFRGLARDGPSVLVLEDWHWADESSRELLVRLARQCRDVPLLVLVAYRPPRTWHMSGCDPVEITLHGLSDDEIARLSAAVLSASSVPPDVLTRVRETTGGNPLFVEELCRSLLESHVVERCDGRLRVASSFERFEIPTSVEVVIRSRLDGLEPAAAEVLHSASVLGSEFREHILAQIVSEPAALRPCLQQLELAAVLQSRQTQGQDRIWSFSHALIRSVAYDSLRHRHRRVLHLRVAETIESSFSGTRRNEHLEALAHHYDRAMLPEKALDYAEAAGMKALAAHALGSARHQLRRALELLDGLPPREDRARRRVAITLKWAQACVYAPDETQIPVVQKAADLARVLGDDLSAAKATTWQGWLLYAAGRQKEAIACCEQGLEDLSARAPNPHLAAQLQATLGQSWAAATEYSRAQPLLTEAIAFWRRLPDRARRGVGLAYALGYSGLIHGDQGKFAEAYAVIEQALELVRGMGKEPLEGSVLTQRGIVEVTQRDWAKASTTAEEMRRVAQRVQAPYVEAMSRSIEGAARFHGRGETERGIELLREATRWMQEARVLLTQSWNAGLLAEALALAGARDEASEAVVTVVERGASWDRMGECRGLRARALAAPGGSKDTEWMWNEALLTAEAKGARPDAALTRFRWAELLATEGRHEQASSLREAAEAAFRSMHMPAPRPVSEIRRRA